MSMPPDQLTALLSHISHEMRTPLSVAQGYVRMLSGGRYGALNSLQAHAASAADRCCQQLTTLAEQLSLLAKIDRGELTLARGPIVLGPLLTHVATDHAPSPDHPVQVEHTPDGDTPPVHADATHLRRTLMTLVAAVVRTAPDESTVILTARPASNGADPSGITIGIALADRLDALLAMRDEELEPLNDFEAGLGLGLALARRVLTAEGGRVGTTRADGVLAVRLTLPVASSSS